MRHARPVLLLFFLALLPIACNKSSPHGGSTSSSTAIGPAVNKQTQYDLSRLAAEVKSTSPERRTKAIQMAAELDGQGEDVIPTLLDALKDSAAGPLGRTSNRPDSTRETAVLALLELKAKGKKALQDSGLKTLEGGLRQKEAANVREHTANAIGYIGPDAKQSAEALSKTCTDPEKEVRAAAFRALEKIKDFPPNLIYRLLTHRNPQVAMEAASQLSWLKPGGEESVHHLLDAIKREPKGGEEPSDIAYIRNAAAEALGNVGKGAESAVPALVEMLVKFDKDEIEKMLRPPKEGDRAANLAGPVLALRKIGKPAVPAVVPLLKSDQPLIRYQAAAVLSGMKPGEAAEALPQIQEALEAERGLPSGQLQIFEELAAATLNHGGESDKIAAGVIELLKSNDEVVRFRGCKLLARLGRKAEPAVAKLVELLNDMFPQVQGAAIEALAAIGPAAKPAVIALAKKLEKFDGDDVPVAREAAKALQNFGPAAAPAAPALAKALDSNDQNMCIDAANALAAIGPEALPAVEAIAKHLTDANSRREERIALLNATAAIGPPAKDAIPAVNRLLAEKETAIRVVAAETLGKIAGGNAEAVAKLGEILKDQRNSPLALQTAALKALAGMGNGAKGAAGDVKAYLDQTKDPSSKVWAAATLVAMGSDSDANAKTVLAALKDTTPAAKTARIAAINAAEFLGARAKPGVPDLIESLKDKSAVSRGDGGQVRERVARALGKLGPNAKDAIKPLTDMLKDPDRSARRAAAEALGLFGPDAVVAAPRLRELARIDSELAGVANAALDRIEPPKKPD
jgi:HEAT repeat protein